MTESPPPARRLTDDSRRTLNELLGRGLPITQAMQIVTAEPGAFEEVSTAPPQVPEPAPRGPWKGDSIAWDPVVAKLHQLRDMDRGCTVFGAQRHRYALNRTVSERQLASVEKRLGVALPPGLQVFYRTIGNGGAGPYYGLYALDNLKRRNPAKPYPGVAALRALGNPNKPQPKDPMLAAISPSRLTGLIAVLTQGCGIYSAIVCSGDVGRVVHFEEDGVTETDDTLVDMYTKWLDQEITRFELVQQLRASSASMDEMTKAMAKLLPAKEVFLAEFEVTAKLKGLQGSKYE